MERGPCEARGLCDCVQALFGDDAISHRQAGASSFLPSLLALPMVSLETRAGGSSFITVRAEFIHHPRRQHDAVTGAECSTLAGSELRSIGSAFAAHSDGPVQPAPRMASSCMVKR